MKCPICQAENEPGLRFCSSCGSNLSTRGGADIMVKDDGTVHHAHDSRWKAGGGLAAGGILIGLAKLKALPFLLFKLYWIFGLVRLTSYGGIATVLGITALVLLLGGSFFRLRRGRRF